MVFLCSCGGLIWENRVHVCGQIRCSCGAIKFNGRGHCCGYTPDYSVPPTNWELYSGYRSFDEWMGSTTWGKRSPSLFNTKNQEKFILNVAASMEDIKNLQQTGAFQDYCKSFDFLLTKVILSEDYATSLFVEGLNSEIKWWVKFLGPKTLKEAYEMANKHNNFLTFLNSAKEVKKVVDPSVSVDFDDKVSVVDVKHSLDDKNGDVIDSKEGIKENVKEIFVNVIDDDIVEGKDEAAFKAFVEMPQGFNNELNVEVGTDSRESEKNDDVSKVEEIIKENVNEIYRNVLDDAIDVREIKEESDNDLDVEVFKKMGNNKGNQLIVFDIATYENDQHGIGASNQVINVLNDHFNQVRGVDGMYTWHKWKSKVLKFIQKFWPFPLDEFSMKIQLMLRWVMELHSQKAPTRLQINPTVNKMVVEVIEVFFSDQPEVVMIRAEAVSKIYYGRLYYVVLQPCLQLVFIMNVDCSKRKVFMWLKWKFKVLVGEYLLHKWKAKLMLLVVIIIGCCHTNCEYSWCGCSRERRWEMDKFMEVHFNTGVECVQYTNDQNKFARMEEHKTSMQLLKDPTIWEVKCMFRHGSHSMEAIQLSAL